MKILKYLGAVILILIVIALLSICWMSEDVPTGTEGPEADQLAQLVMRNLGQEAFDTTHYIQWEFFRPGQKYVWDKKNDLASIEWDETNVVFMDLKTQEAICLINGQKQTGSVHDEMKEKAWSNWCNDSFWLIAPFKMFDPGTKRTKVITQDNENAVLITYESGGVTPGDQYLWILDDNNIPKSWKMWTSIIPIKGISTTWSNWKDYNGVQLASDHTLLGIDLFVEDIKVGQNLTEMGLPETLFNDLKG